MAGKFTASDISSIFYYQLYIKDFLWICLKRRLNYENTIKVERAKKT